MIYHIAKVVKIRRPRWLGHLFRIQELDPCRKLTLLKPEGTRCVEKPKLRCLESIEEDLKNMGVSSWRRKSRDRDGWRTILEEAEEEEEEEEGVILQQQIYTYIYMYVCY